MYSRNKHILKQTKKNIFGPVMICNQNFRMPFGREIALMSKIECKYCLIGTSYLAGSFDIFTLLQV